MSKYSFKRRNRGSENLLLFYDIHYKTDFRIFKQIQFWHENLWCFFMPGDGNTGLGGGGGLKDGWIDIRENRGDETAGLFIVRPGIQYPDLGLSQNNILKAHTNIKGWLFTSHKRFFLNFSKYLYNTSHHESYVRTVYVFFYKLFFQRILTDFKGVETEPWNPDFVQFPVNILGALI
jgi:hypothetical protein